MVDVTGLKTVAAEAVEAGDAMLGSDGGEQLDLLPLPLCQAQQVNGRAENGFPAAKGRGRPPGASNKSTEAWREWFLKRYSSPLIGLAEMYSRTPGDLAKELGLNDPLTFAQALQILQLQKSAMESILPYVHKKQPIAIDAGEGGLINLFIGTMAQSTQEDAPKGMEIIDYNHEQNQGVSDA